MEMFGSEFPTEIPTDNSNFQPGGDQTLYFDEKGLLQQLDYVTVGPGAHYTFDHTNFKGIVVPTFRRVVLRSP